MILEAFSSILKERYSAEASGESSSENSRSTSACYVLQCWLLDHLNHPVTDETDHVHRVIRTEFSASLQNGLPVIEAKTKSGAILLESLYDYCRAYEDWQYRRWLHTLSASDFESSLLS